MKNFFGAISFIMLVIINAGCKSTTTKEQADSSAAPAVADTMPVLRPNNLDSGGNIKTPPTNDSNVIMPDSAIKSK